MLHFFKKVTTQVEVELAEDNSYELVVSPITGKAVESKEINDPVFSEEMLGRGLAIVPTEGRVYAPVSGKIEMMHDSMHAVSLTSDKGAEILVHIGLDTVSLNGRHYTRHANEGDYVKAGQLLLEFDIPAIQAEGFDTIAPVVICNTDDYTEVLSMEGRDVKAGQGIIKLIK